MIANDFVRAPGMRMDPITARELEATVARVGLSLAQRGVFHVD